MNILVISNNYPSESMPSRGVFVYKLIQQFVKLGHQVSVISPEGISFNPKKNTKKSYGNELATVYRPKYLSASAKNIFGFNTYRIGEQGQVWAVERTIKEYKIEFDIVYAHFLSNTFIALQATSTYGKPVFAAVGEYNNIDVRRAYYSTNYYAKMLSRVTGFIAVSPQIVDKLVSLGVDENKISMKPNGVDFNLFFKQDKIEMRKKHGLPLDKRLAIFVGRFVETKGPLKLLAAAENIKNLGLILVGSGEQQLESEKIVFKNKVASNVVPELLSAADVFVLPTHHEGSSNAIVEAMACGLPIVSSDLPEIRVQCNDSFSILVDPLNEEAINIAISAILSNPEKTEEMSRYALENSKKFDITKRAKDILDFITTME
ncbi:glycosyltransferase family 4 protein [Aurantibacter crassamenti]|uniref:glycosyltransferase family 4 protein n=1 Tax=Aurantibacter crassamenti TaxID=1837375 RepID=UPI001939ECC0|nr:glycosyltransferase family 4 protein [Aurantibacter crassamenti]MBM1106765.1 glycosyltransferase family 4 protein [Aurantibacter crassamenti]